VPLKQHFAPPNDLRTSIKVLAANSPDFTLVASPNFADVPEESFHLIVVSKTEDV
jgi:hypothetical protein